MRITAIHEKTIPLHSDLRNAYIDFSKMTASAVAVITDVIRDGKPIVGYGFNSNGRYAAGGLMHERFIPRIMNANPLELIDDTGANLDPHRVWKTMMTGEKPGGHGERSVAVGAIDMAIWDVVAKIDQKPLYLMLAERYGTGSANSKVWVYAAGGYYQPGKGIEGLKNEIRSYLDLGYTDVKIKIGGASLKEDIARIEAVLEIVGSGHHLAVDANGRFDLPTALEYANAIEPYHLRWYEEAGDPLDYQLQAVLCEQYLSPLATGENLFSTLDARNLIRYGGMRPDRDILQFDCALSYGLVEYMRTLQMLNSHGWSTRSCVPHGGHQMSLNIAAGLGLGGNESYPGVFQPFGGFADHISIDGGYVQLPGVPGIGLEEKANLYSVLRLLCD